MVIHSPGKGLVYIEEKAVPARFMCQSAVGTFKVAIASRRIRIELKS
jgi:hypothetical protein